MTTWFTGGHHFGHQNIAKYENRPDGWQDLAIDRWNEVVKDDDTVIHIGDFVFGPVDYGKMILNCLKGQKYILLGNHDRSPQNMRDMGFLNVWGNRRQAKYGDSQFWMKYYVLTAGSPGGFSISAPICLSHAPLPDLKGFGRFNIHGHIHSNGYPVDLMGGQKPWHVNVEVDVTDYYPISIEQILGGYR